MNNKATTTSAYIIFPPFVSLFINDSGKTCIYYWRGLDSDGKFAYQMFNESDLPKYTKTINDDGSIIYEFKRKINNIQCTLISDIYPNKKIFVKL